MSPNNWAVETGKRREQSGLPIQIASLVALAAASYLAMAEERDTIGCFLVFHEIGAESREA